MAQWEIRTRQDTVQVEGTNWLLALGAALPNLGLEPAVLSRLVCDVQSNGVVRILDPVLRDAPARPSHARRHQHARRAHGRTRGRGRRIPPPLRSRTTSPPPRSTT